MSLALTRREQAGLLALVAVRVSWMFARLYAEPQRFWNFEEAYNATVGWALAHGVWADILDLQYRTFCGGCTVVAVVAAPVLAVSDTFVAWKLVAVGWTAATMIAAFFALDRWAGRPAAWAALALFALPPLGGLDLSLMLWGNHQESAILGLLALLLVNRPIAAGLVLGASVWFARTAVYQVVVLAPLLVYVSGWRVGIGMMFGLGLLALPTADGDAGFYRMNDSFGVADWRDRAETLFAPADLAKRLFHPLKELEAGAWVWLAAAATGLLAKGRARVFVAWALTYAGAYCLTTFPIFIVSARSPVNNIRYHAPWIFVLTLLVAIGVGRLWVWRRSAGAFVLTAVLLVNLAALARATWTPAPCVGTLRASWPAKFATVAGSRLSLDRLRAGADDPRLDAALQTMYGFRRGEVAGDVPLDELGPYALRGFGLARADNASAVEWNTWLDGLDPAIAREIGRGLALGRTGSRPGSRRPSGDGRGDTLPGEDAARILIDCHEDATCVKAALTTAPEAAWVAGITYARPDRTRCTVEAFAAELPEEFREGASDPMAGTPEAPQGVR